MILDTPQALHDSKPIVVPSKGILISPVVMGRFPNIIQKQKVGSKQDLEQTDLLEAHPDIFQHIYTHFSNYIYPIFTGLNMFNVIWDHLVKPIHLWDFKTLGSLETKLFWTALWSIDIATIRNGKEKRSSNSRDLFTLGTLFELWHPKQYEQQRG